MVGRTTLICASLNNSPMYHMSVYLLPKTTVKEIDKIRRTFFWPGGGTKRKYHLVKWAKICKHKKKRGCWDQRPNKVEHQLVMQMVVEG